MLQRLCEIFRSTIICQQRQGTKECHTRYVEVSGSEDCEERAEDTTAPLLLPMCARCTTPEGCIIECLRGEHSADLLDAAGAEERLIPPLLVLPRYRKLCRSSSER